jgi:hypothetical protein
MEKCSSYNAGFKLKVTDYAEKHANWTAGTGSSVTEFNVRYWHKQKLALQNTNKSRKAFQGPKSGKLPKLEGEIRLPYLLECNAHLFWPNYVAKIRVRIRFNCKLEKHLWSRCSASSHVFVLFSR